jgi:hypothetical protein
MEAKLEVLQEHTKLNEKQKQIEDSFMINIEEYKNKILCIQCGKQSEKIKCEKCAKENFHKRNKSIVTLTSVKPNPHYGRIVSRGNKVIKFLDRHINSSLPISITN